MATMTTEFGRGKSSSRRLALLLMVLGVLLGGAASALGQFSGPAVDNTNTVNRPVTFTTDQAILYPGPRDLKIAAGDLILVHVFGTTDFAPAVRVSVDGSVQLPLIGIVALDGLTLHEAESLIAERLVSAGMYRNPQVTIQLTESPNQVVTVVGEMHGTVPVVGQKRLLDVLSAAGGLPLTASHTITINRPGVDQPIIVNLGTDPARSALANIPVFPHDTVVVSRVGVVYVLGAFRTQGAIPLNQNSPLTLMQVAALGGGPGFEGKYDDLRIIRTVGYDRKVVRVDIEKVIKGKVPDPVLEADDIVFLPPSNFKAAIKAGGIGTLIGIVSFLIFSFKY